MNEEIFVPENMTLLIVDDNPANIDVLRETVKPQGYKVAIATNGEQALKISEKLMPDLILLDVMMPGMNGFEVCVRLKQNPITVGIPVIFITAKTEPDDISNGFNIGGVDYISKPFRREEVCSRVQTHLKLSVSSRVLKEMNAQLKEINEQKNSLLGMVAHDLRTPLYVMLSFLNLVIKNEEQQLSESDITEIHQLMFEMCQEIMFLVNEVLDMSAIEAGSVNLDIQLAELNKIIDKRICINRFNAEEKGLKLISNSTKSVNAYVDICRISRVLDNLLGNAIKFSPPGTQIVVDVKEKSRFAMISIKDQGPGMSDETLQRICSQSDVQVEAEKGRNGSGLGLAIVKKIIEAHNGHLEIVNTEDSGVTFNICVPVEFSGEDPQFKSGTN